MKDGFAYDIQQSDRGLLGKHPDHSRVACMRDHRLRRLAATQHPFDYCLLEAGDENHDKSITVPP